MSMETAIYINMTLVLLFALGALALALWSAKRDKHGEEVAERF